MTQTFLEPSFWEELSVVVVKAIQVHGLRSNSNARDAATSSTDSGYEKNDPIIITDSIRQYVRQRLLQSAENPNRATPSLFIVAWEAYTLCSLVDVNMAAQMISEEYITPFNWYSN
jgi:hypothetical protein